MFVLSVQMLFLGHSERMLKKQNIPPWRFWFVYPINSSYFRSFFLWLSFCFLCLDSLSRKHSPLSGKSGGKNPVTDNVGSDRNRFTPKIPMSNALRIVHKNRPAPEGRREHPACSYAEPRTAETERRTDSLSRSLTASWCVVIYDDYAEFVVFHLSIDVLNKLLL